MWLLTSVCVFCDTFNPVAFFGSTCSVKFWNSYRSSKNMTRTNLKQAGNLWKSRPKIKGSHRTTFGPWKMTWNTVQTEYVSYEKLPSVFRHVFGGKSQQHANGFSQVSGKLISLKKRGRFCADLWVNTVIVMCYRSSISHKYYLEDGCTDRQKTINM